MQSIQDAQQKGIVDLMSARFKFVHEHLVVL